MSHPSHTHQHHTGALAEPDPRRWRALAVLCVVQFMVILDVTVVNVALPDIGTDLRLSPALLPWTVSAYTLVFGGLLLLGGRLSDAIGRRRTFLAGLAIFTAASLACGLAGSGEMLIAARLVQGLGAALVSPAALAIITTTFTGSERNRALGVWAALGGTGSVIGVLLGGVLTAGPGWPWVFIINVPIGIAMLLLAPFSVPAAAPAPGTGRIDILGAITLTATTGLLIFGLVNAGARGWSSTITWLPIVVGLLSAVAFVVVERTVDGPLVPLNLVSHRPVVAGNIAMLGASGLLIAGFFLCSLYLQRVAGYSALRTGLVFLPVALVMIVGAHLASRLVGRFGWRPIALAGFGLAAVGYGWLALVPDSSGPLVKVLPGFVVAATGLAAMFVTATTSAMNDVDHERAGLISGVVNTSHEFGASLGVAAASAIAGASLAGAGATAGFDNALGAAAIAAAVIALLTYALLPTGRPRADAPVFAH
jgi:EmrB/QacA subfamily drug resistance transporter